MQVLGQVGQTAEFLRDISRMADFSSSIVSISDKLQPTRNTLPSKDFGRFIGVSGDDTHGD
jgi:hypothetical protein